jgi:hypothetical protein
LGRKLKKKEKALRFDIPPKNKPQRGVAQCSISLWLFYNQMEKDIV